MRNQVSAEGLPLTRREPPKLSEVLFGSKGFDSLAAVPSNVEAIETALLFSTGLQTFAALIGPSGWGKTHLLQAVARKLRYDAGYRDCEVQSANEWVNSAMRTDPHVPLLLDNVQDAMTRTRSRVALRLALERRTRAGRPTILGFTSSKASRTIKGFLPLTRQWAIATIHAPVPAERQIIVSKIAETEGVAISAELLWLLGNKLRGNGLTVRGAMKRLKLHEGTWLGAAGTLRACGVLNPFFSDNSSWDLREHIMDCARTFPRDCQDLSDEDLAVYVMLREALLGESDVARFFEIEPAHAYNAASRFEARLKSCDRSRELVTSFIEHAVARLQID